ncbi:diguanylate cyclase [Clostridium sp. C8-1-8]|uniref:diguanylate cyclase domain-containing protein n=1 Tax=Clostridium sp. C8-1-8 TaxID=2698831 RepID=UPI00136B4A16|nr:diguanylate cyclase [Clostridium sp. C8-1-8]
MQLLKPSVALMRNLRYIRKFELIFAIMLLPMSIMMFIFIFQISKELNYAKKQKIGLEYNFALDKLTGDIQRHRGLLSVYLSGDVAFNKYIDEDENNIKKDIEQIEILNTKYDEDLKVKDKWKALNAQWLEVESNISIYTREESFDEHSKLIFNINDMSQYVADISLLRVQKKIEDHYVANDLINTLPNIIEQMGQARAIGARSAARKNLTSYDSENLEYITKEIKQRLKETEKSMKVISNNSNDKKKLTQSYEGSIKAIDDLIYTLNSEFSYKKDITIGPDEFFFYATEKMDEVKKLSMVEADILLKQSESQIRDLDFSRNLITLSVLAILASIIYLFLGFYKSILDSILSIKGVAAKIAEGDLSERIHLECEDEVREIGDSVNKMLDRLIDNYHEVRRARDISEKVANHDWLTGVPNRAFFMRKLEDLIEEYKDTETKFAILFIDLDRFKWINDNLGHQMGDIVLKEVAKRLVDVIKKKGIVCRLGGDEFTVILTDFQDKKDIMDTIAKIEKYIEEPLTLGNNKYSVGASIGSVIHPDEADGFDELIQKADIAMYDEKRKKKCKNLS